MRLRQTLYPNSPSCWFPVGDDAVVVVPPFRRFPPRESQEEYIACVGRLCIDQNNGECYILKCLAREEHAAVRVSPLLITMLRSCLLLCISPHRRYSDTPLFPQQPGLFVSCKSSFSLGVFFSSPKRRHNLFGTPVHRPKH